MSAMGRKLTQGPNAKFGWNAEAARMCYGASVRMIVALYVAAMIALIVGLDVTLFRHHFWERLAANVGIVLVFAAFYGRFLRDP